MLDGGLEREGIKDQHCCLNEKGCCGDKKIGTADLKENREKKVGKKVEKKENAEKKEPRCQRILHRKEYRTKMKTATFG